MTWALSYRRMVPVALDEPTWYRLPCAPAGSADSAAVAVEPPAHSTPDKDCDGPGDRR